MTTPADLEALKLIEEAQAQGLDPFGDNDPIVDNETEIIAEVVPEIDRVPEVTEVPEVVEPEPPETKTAKAKQEETPQDPVERERPMQYQTELPADYAKQRGELTKEKAGLMKKLLEGEIDADQYAEQEAALNDRLEALSAARIRAETLQEANKQAESRYQINALNKLARKVKNDIDYANDEKARNQFNTALKILAVEEGDFEDMIQEAHAMVMARRGIAQAAKKPEPASRKPEGTPPVTLRSIPAASTPNTGGSVIEQMSRLKGAEFEKAYASLTPAQQAALLDS